MEYHHFKLFIERGTIEIDPIDIEDEEADFIEKLISEILLVNLRNKLFVGEW